MTKIELSSTDYRLKFSWDNSKETQESGSQEFKLQYDEKAGGCTTLTPYSGEIQMPTYDFAEVIFELLSSGFEGIPSGKSIKLITVKRSGRGDDITVTADESFDTILARFAKRSRII